VSSKAIIDWLDACNAEMKYMHGFVVVRHGKVIAEGAWAPFDPLTRPHMLYSHSKSFTSTAIGFLADEGKVDLDERIADIFADKMPTNPPPELLEVRVRDLLTMNFGSDASHAPKCNFALADWEKGILSRPMERRPGTKHRYDSDATYLLSCIVERKSGMRTMDYLKAKLFDPLGMTSPWSTVSPSGTACGGWGMNMTTRDIAKFGQFLLDGGVWDGKQLLSRDWIRLASAKHTASGGGPDWRLGYGFQFWRCQHNAYRADGAAGQFTIVMEDQDAVVSLNAAEGNTQKELDLVWKHLVPAFGDRPLPDDAELQSRLADKCAKLEISAPKGTGLAGPALPAACSYGRSNLMPEGKGTLEKSDSGWTLVGGNRRLAIGDGAWAETTWKFDDGNVEPLFALVGTRTAIAAGRWTNEKTLRVSWHLLDCTQKGEFEVKVQ
jgi:CubicO group peptidase (beta-lactamase class C family)